MNEVNSIIAKISADYRKSATKKTLLVDGLIGFAIFSMIVQVDNLLKDILLFNLFNFL